jgi:hypothetical protein
VNQHYQETLRLPYLYLLERLHHQRRCFLEFLDCLDFLQRPYYQELLLFLDCLLLQWHLDYLQYQEFLSFQNYL